MAESKRPRKVPAEASRPAVIEAKWNLLEPDFVFLDDGYAIPRKFTVSAEFKDQPLTVAIDVEIEDKRARSRAVTVSTSRKNGVSSTTLRAVPIRDLVATGCTQTLHKVESKTGTDFALAMPGPYGPEEIEAVQRLVGYVDEVVQAPLIDQSAVVFGSGAKRSEAR